MISHEHKCIFIHIPKCAGTSIENALGHHSEWSGPGRQDHRTLRMYQPGVPLSAFCSKQNFEQLLKKFYRLLKYRKFVNPRNKRTVSRKQYENYFKFTVVRNPWDRVFSWYKNVMQDQGEVNNEDIFSDSCFEDYLQRQVCTGSA